LGNFASTISLHFNHLHATSAFSPVVQRVWKSQHLSVKVQKAFKRDSRMSKSDNMKMDHKPEVKEAGKDIAQFEPNI
jgi:hypothetical protein